LLVEVNVILQEESMNVTDLCDVTHGVLRLGPTVSETAVSSETFVPVYITL
jgi:hypothetical protein